MTHRFREGERVWYEIEGAIGRRFTPHNGEWVTVDDDEGGDRVQISHTDGSASYVNRWHLHKK